MSEQMSFVYVQATRHVLSVLTTLAASKTPPQVTDLASPSLLVRDLPNADPLHKGTVPQGIFQLTPDLLNVFTGDVISEALINPRGYSWKPDTKDVQALSGSGVTVASASPGVTVTLPVASSGTTKILAFYAGADPAKSDYIPASIPGGSTTITFGQSSLGVGTYVLVLVEEFPPVVLLV